MKFVPRKSILAPDVKLKVLLACPEAKAEGADS